MTPTQIEALKKIAALRWPPYKDSLLSAIAIAKAALAAAAEVEERRRDIQEGDYLITLAKADAAKVSPKAQALAAKSEFYEDYTHYDRALIAAEREACAQVAEARDRMGGWVHQGNEKIAAAIRARKDHQG